MKSLMKWFKEHKIITLVCLAMIGGAFYYGYSGNSSEAEDATMETMTVNMGDINVSVSGTGQVSAGTQVDLKPQVAGDGVDIMEVRVENDQEVKEDDILAILDTTDIDQKINSAALSVQSSQISLKQAENDYDTETKDDKYQRQSKEIALAQSQVSLSNYYQDREDYYIRAPFDGTVTGLDFEAGDSISQTETFASVITDDVKAEISLNEVDAAMVEVGNEVHLTFDALDDVEATGTVSKVDTIGVVDGGVVTYDVEIAFESPSELLKPGMSMTAEIIIDSASDVLRVSQSAIEEGRDGSLFVLVSDGSGDPSSVTRQSVETGIADDTMIEITSGLSEGDIVVTKMVDGASAAKKESDGEDDSSGSLLPTPGSGNGPGGGQGPGR